MEQVFAAADGTGEFVWISLTSPTADEMAELAARLALPELAVEDAVHAHQRPKLDTYAEHLFAVLKPIDPAGEGATELAVFLGPGYLVTVQHGDSPVLDRIRKDPEAGDQGPGGLLHRIADAVVDDYETIVEALQSAADDIEERVFGDRTGTDHAEDIYQLKRRLAELRRVVAPLVLPTGRLADGAVHGIDGDLAPYFRDVHDHVLRAAETVEAIDRLLSDALQADQSRLSVRQNEIALRQNDVAAQQNEDMRKMSAWAAIALVPTAIAGIYGMNFEYMPELHWRYGYFVVIALIAGVCVGLYATFRRNGWL